MGIPFLDQPVEHDGIDFLFVKAILKVKCSTLMSNPGRFAAPIGGLCLT